MQKYKRLSNKTCQQTQHNFSFPQPQKKASSTLNKYMKKKSSSDTKSASTNNSDNSSSQYKKYLLDTTNVFYQDRETLKKMNRTKLLCRYLLPFWLFMTILYAFIYPISPYKGVCPKNATCNVYLRCNPGFQMNQEDHQCHVKKSIIDQIQNTFKFQIQQLKLQYGNNDCSVKKTDIIPSRNVNNLIPSLTKGLQRSISEKVQQKINQFLKNSQNQKLYEFKYDYNNITPLSKKHSLSCILMMYYNMPQFRLQVLVGLILLIALAIFFMNYMKKLKAYKIYNFLKQKLKMENKLNITLLSNQIKTNFGDFDQNIWNRVEQCRIKEQRIIVYEDQFLYWKHI